MHICATEHQQLVTTCTYANLSRIILSTEYVYYLAYGKIQKYAYTCQRRDSTDGRAAALYPADPGSNPVVSMLQRALRLSVSAGRQTQLIMNRSWSRTLIVALLHWLDYKTLQLLLLLKLATMPILSKPNITKFQLKT